MNWPATLAILCLLVPGTRAQAVDLRQRTDSSSRQFAIYCEDAKLRGQVASFAEKLKLDLLQLLGETDHWKHPIVVTLESSSDPNPREPARLRVVQVEGGMKIEINVRIGDDPATVNLQKHLLRALLLEMIYRPGGVTPGSTYVEPPWWLLEAALKMFRRENAATHSDLFRKLVETNKLPPIEKFLAEKPENLGPTALALDAALAMCFVQLLTEQPDGRHHLAALVRAWPGSNGDPVASIAREYPTLAGGAPVLQKWWTLNLARMAAADRYLGLSAEDTDRQITALLSFEIVEPKSGQTQRYALADFARYLPLPTTRAVLAGQRNQLTALTLRANTLLRPALSEYDEIFALLLRGKTRGLAERLQRVEQLRGVLLRRIADIADYLNWYEATQMTEPSDAFDNYLRTANEISNEEREHRGPIARYLDQLEKEY